MHARERADRGTGVPRGIRPDRPAEPQTSRYRPGTSPRSVPVTMGTRTALPHSVHEPS